MTDDDLHVLKDLVSALTPLQMVIKRLSSHGSDLLVADGAFRFIFEELSNNKGEICQAILSTVKERV